MKTKHDLEAMIAQLRIAARQGRAVRVDAGTLLQIMESLQYFEQQREILASIAEEVLCDSRPMIPVPRDTLLMLAGKAGAA